jgi:hypothetical protein
VCVGGGGRIGLIRKVIRSMFKSEFMGAVSGEERNRLTGRGGFDPTVYSK